MSSAASVSRRPADRAVLGAVLALSAIGTVAVFSAVAFLVDRSGGTPQGLLASHLVRLGLAFGALVAFSRIDYHKLARVSKPLLLGSLVLLVLVQLVGAATNGAQRWLTLGSTSFQPSDLARVALILHTAVLLTRKQAYITDVRRGFVPLAVWAGATVVLIGMENLSTAAVLSVTLAAMYFVGRVRLLHMAAIALVGLVLAGGLLATSPARAARVEAFVQTSLFGHTDDEHVFDRQGEGYQADQARLAFAMGGATGVGPGKSAQRHFLPAPYNDFIFAIIAEEYGIVGGAVVLCVFVWLLAHGFLRVARGAADPLGLFLATGLTTAVVLYGFVNAMVACGLMPVTGLPLPFISWGGTALIANGVMVGILLNISRHAAPPAG